MTRHGIVIISTAAIASRAQTYWTRPSLRKIRQPRSVCAARFGLLFINQAAFA